MTALEQPMTSVDVPLSEANSPPNAETAGVAISTLDEFAG
jgi:hypothetical protein